MELSSDTPTSQIAIVGATTWGTTLAIVLARRGINVRLLARSQAESEHLGIAGEHPRLPGHRFPPSLVPTADWGSGMVDADAVIFAIPSHSVRDNARRASPFILGSTLVVSASKGLEQGTDKRMTVVLGEELQVGPEQICALSGPNLAHEIIVGLPTSTVVASNSTSASGAIQAIMNSSELRVYTNSDVIGTELGGALKNVIAISAGVCDGMALGDNAKAALLTRGLAEMTRLGVAMGAEEATFSGNAGLGDLLATCFSKLSRNYRIGAALGSGSTLTEALNALGGQVAEGVTTAPSAVSLGRSQGVDMPIAEITRQILFDGISPKEALLRMMSRQPRAE